MEPATAGCPPHAVGPEMARPRLPRWLRWPLRIVLAIAITLVGANLAMISPDSGSARPKARVEAVPPGRSPDAPAADDASSPDAPSTGPKGTSGPRVRALPPLRVEVPAIGVDADVIKLGKNADGTLDTPDDFSKTGWWSGGYAPGGTGPAVIVGHVDNKSGPAVFYDLSEVVAGDHITVEAADGARRDFVVNEVKEYKKVAFPTDEVYGRTDHPTLRLVTCGGEFDSSTGHYLNNVVVYADLAA